MEENKVAQMTKHSKSTRVIDSASRSKEETVASEIREINDRGMYPTTLIGEKNHWWGTLEVGGRWVSKCADCGLTQDIHDMTERQIYASTLATAGQCPGKPVAAAEN